MDEGILSWNRGRSTQGEGEEEGIGEWAGGDAAGIHGDGDKLAIAEPKRDDDDEVTGDEQPE